MKVSIIVPVFNSEKYIRDTLDSLVNQTISDYEIVIVDDASNDGSYEIIREYQSKYPSKIKVIRNEKNLGQSVSRNKGILVSSGEYIGFLDSDDFVNYDMYKTMYEGALENNKPEVIVTGLYFVKDNSYLKNNFKDMRRQKGVLHNVLKEPEFVLSQSPSVCNKLFRKDTIKDLFLEGKMWEDVAFSFSKMFNANNILYFNNPDYFYRRRIDDGVSSLGYKVNTHLLDIFDVADSIKIETSKTNRYEILKNYINYLQIYTCLQRVSEVMEWNISTKDKDYLCNLMSNLIIKKYGDWRKLPHEDLSYRMGVIELEKLINLTSINSQDIENIESDIISTLSDLKK